MTSSSLTAEQQNALEKMRQTFSEKPSSSPDPGFICDDRLYLRYLRARNFDVDKAVLMLNATLQWREKFGLKNIHEWIDTIRVENDSGKMYTRGFDRDGSILLYMKPRLENSKNHDGNLKHLVYNMERAISTMERTTGEEKLVLLIDYDGYNLSSAPPMKTSMETLSILQNHYPERLRCAYCLRPPWVFNAFWSVISPFIDPITKNKIKMVPAEQLRKQLLEKIDPTVLEASCGGDDTRPFLSLTYLDAEFHLDYFSIMAHEEQKR